MSAQPEHLVAAGKRWRKVNAPKRWHAAEGEVLQGVYLGRQHKDGRFGPYQAVLVQEEGSSQVRTLSGSVIVSLFDGAAIEAGATVRVCFLGERVNKTGDRSYQDFDLYVLEGS